MIFDDLKNAFKYYDLAKNLKKGFEFLINNDLNSLQDGKYLIDGENVFANVQSLKTKQKEDKKFEAHRKYIDIQYLIKGFECMGFGLLDDFKKEICPYDNDKDLIFLDGEKYNYINLKEGEFVIFYPHDVHAPMLCDKEPGDIKKVIVKVAI